FGEHLAAQLVRAREEPSVAVRGVDRRLREIEGIRPGLHRLRGKRHAEECVRRLAAGNLVRALVLLQRGKVLALLEELPAFLELVIHARGALREECRAGNDGEEQRAHLRQSYYRRARIAAAILPAAFPSRRYDGSVSGGDAPPRPATWNH